MAMVRRCDMCGKELYPQELHRFRLRKAKTYEAALFDGWRMQWERDLCKSCAKNVVDYFNRGGKDDA